MDFDFGFLVNEARGAQRSHLEMKAIRDMMKGGVHAVSCLCTLRAGMCVDVGSMNSLGLEGMSIVLNCVT